jgi:hypothetical protein
MFTHESQSKCENLHFPAVDSKGRLEGKFCFVKPWLSSVKKLGQGFVEQCFQDVAIICS